MMEFILFTVMICGALASLDKCDDDTFSFKGHRALIVTTSYGEPIGPRKEASGVASWEMTAPYWIFNRSQMDVDLVSIKGGQIPISWIPGTDPTDKAFKNDPVAMKKSQNSLAIADVDLSKYDVVFMAGGWGAAFDLGYSTVLGSKIAARDAAGGLIGSTCHGALGFVNGTKPDGSPLVAGRTMTAVTDKQIQELHIEKYTPMHPETELKKLGANYECVHGAITDLTATDVVVDKNWATGQNQNSSCQASQALLRLLKARLLEAIAA